MSTFSSSRFGRRPRSLVFAVAVLLGAGLSSAPGLAGDVAALREAAKSKEMTPRRKAMKALVADGSPEAVTALLDAAAAAEARKDSIGVRDAAFHLEKVQSSAATPVLLKALEKGIADKRGLGNAVVTALGNTRDPKAAPALRKVLDTADDKPLHNKAYVALAKVTDDPADVARFAKDLKDRKTASEATKAMKNLENPALAPALYPLLRDPDIDGAPLQAVIGALGRMAVPAAAGPLLDLVERDERRGVAAWAADALVACAEPEHVARMQKLITAKGGNSRLHKAFIAADRRQRFKATQALLTKEPSVATALLNQVILDVHPSDEDLAHRAIATKPVTRTGDPLRRAGVMILGRLDSEKAEQALCRELKNKDNTSVVRTDAVEGLGRMGTEGAVTCLIDVLESEGKLKASSPRKFSVNVFEDSARALQRISGEKLGEDPKAWKTWHSSGLKAGFDGLVAGLAHSEPAVRALSASRLREMAKKGDLKKPDERAKARDGLLAALAKERKGDVRTDLVEALGALKDPAAVDGLVEVLEQSGSKSFEEKVALARALDELGDGRGTATLIEQLGSEKDDERMEAAKALSLVTGEPLHYDANKWREWWKNNAERYRR